MFREYRGDEQWRCTVEMYELCVEMNPDGWNIIITIIWSSAIPLFVPVYHSPSSLVPVCPTIISGTPSSII
eukprot:scaffold33814_cov70-Attheya_sp.AAC.2